MERIKTEHGSGGSATTGLIHEIFAQAFSNPVLDEMEDAAVVDGGSRLAVTTDSFVVTPVIYRGGDIGRLAVCGTVNDLLMRGAVPRYLTCGFILQTGLEIDTLRRIVASMARTAAEAGVQIVAGDTKVVEGEGALYINTAGVGIMAENLAIGAAQIKEGDAILISGDLGRHHAAIMSERMEIESRIESDNAPLGGMVTALLDAGITLHAMRDITRGGLATILKELAQSSGMVFGIREEALPLEPQVRDFCGLLGLDPLYMGCEGRMAVILPREEAQRALDVMHRAPYGENAVCIGETRAPRKPGEAGALVMETVLGTHRLLDILHGEGLPRIC